MDQLNRAYETHEQKKTVEILSRLIRAEPLNSGYIAERGFAHLEIGEYEKGLNDLDEALSVTPDIPNSDRIFRTRGDIYIQKKKYLLSIQDYSSAIRLNPVFHGQRTKRAKAYLLSKQYEKCIEDCSFTIKNEDTSGQNLNVALAHYLRSKAYTGIGNVSAAAQDITAANEKGLRDFQKIDTN